MVNTAGCAIVHSNFSQRGRLINQSIGSYIMRINFGQWGTNSIHHTYLQELESTSPSAKILDKDFGLPNRLLPQFPLLLKTHTFFPHHSVRPVGPKSHDNVILWWSVIIHKNDSETSISLGTGILLVIVMLLIAEGLDLCCVLLAITVKSFQESHKHHVQSHASPQKC